MPNSTHVILAGTLVCILALLMLQLSLSLQYTSKQVFLQRAQMYGTRLQLPQVTARHMPRTVWMYWHGEPPEIVQKCVHKTRQLLTPHGFTVHLLSDANVLQYVPAAAAEAMMALIGNVRYKITHFSDWLRFYLLYTRGGVWMDASIVLNDAVRVVDLVQLIEGGKADVFMFHNPLHQRTQSRVLESFFIIAPTGCPFLRAAYNNFVHAYCMQPRVYQQREWLRNRLKLPWIMLQPYWVVYNAIYAAMQETPEQRIASQDVTAAMFYNGQYLMHSLVLRDPTTAASLPYIKLIQASRRELEKVQYEKWAYLFEPTAA